MCMISLRRWTQDRRSLVEGLHVICLALRLPIRGVPSRQTVPVPSRLQSGKLAHEAAMPPRISSQL